MPHLSFTVEPLSEIVPAVRAALEGGQEVTLEIPDPDAGLGLYAGELYTGVAGPAGRHRPWSAWADLADALGAHLLTPQPFGPGRARFGLRRYAAAPAPDAGGYGVGGDWARVDKLEDPVLLLTLVEALRRINPPAGGRVLALGVNSGRELDALALAFPERLSPDRHLLDQHFPDRHFEIVGLDTDASALDVARGRFPRAEFLELDVAELPVPALGRFDLILALSLLQSPGVRRDVLLKALCRHHLTEIGGLVLGFPNARYRDGLLSYGARMKNFARPDLSLLCADVTDTRRDLQKRGFQVFVTGKYEVLLTALPVERRIGRELSL
ncbi:class I SAM-dependent methyltransferase [Deinococcus sp. AJ005]|uniref:class I SAM-dependent methyltransferase n=1 Tax=Deinococcus sp. AJ005 TaxID=2652443 RepID=UPI00125CD356|nr:class I SAM-dependent methyltransferase [Deinococcus sp. AJ005]QFP75465.1 class I SAM-dependent methyltransferase [Deinococcus sp. AJ005]